MSTDQWFREFERTEAMREERLDIARANMRRFTLEDARTHLRRAIERHSSMLRTDELYRARDALIAADLPRLADIAEAAATRIGGSGENVEKLLFEVDCLISRETHCG
jgi:hypothetical protein